MGTVKFLNKWEGHEFESSCYTTEECKEFYKDLRTWLKKELANVNCELVDFNKGHFYASGFIKNNATEKIAYFSIGDLRDYNWNKVLYRTAKDTKDFTGGNNNYSYFENLAESMARITR